MGARASVFDGCPVRVCARSRQEQQACGSSAPGLIRRAVGGRRLVYGRHLGKDRVAKAADRREQARDAGRDRAAEAGGERAGRGRVVRVS